MQERIIILGAGVMQGPAIRIAKELGFVAVALDGNADAPCVSMADEFEQIDLKDKEGIEAFARSLRGEGGGWAARAAGDGRAATAACGDLDCGGLGGIMTAGTDFSASVAWVAERLGLPGIPYEAALNASDKSRMRSCFKKAGLPSPDFITIAQGDNLSLPGFGSGVAPQFPLVVKPVDNMGGRGCRRVNSIEEFSEAAADALRFSRSGRAIVETFMEGPEFSVDAIVYHGEITICGLADRHIFFPPYFIEMGHTMPTAIPTEQAEAIIETFCAGVRALGLAENGSVGAAKGDIKLTANGPMIGEIAARLSGGYMSGWTYPYSSGVEPIRAAILAAMGRKPDGLAPLKRWTSTERAFVSIPGTVKTVCGVDAARSRPHVRDLFLRVAEGSKVSFPENNVSKCGNIISAAPERAEAVEAAESAARSILIHLDPADEETAAFLMDRAHDRFPPSAFQPTAELLSALEQLPETTAGAEAATPTSGAKNRNMGIIPFPEFASSGLRDYAGRSIEESLAAIRALTGFSLPEIAESSDNNNNLLLGRSFWAAFIRGGYQGAVYYIDRL